MIKFGRTITLAAVVAGAAVLLTSCGNAAPADTAAPDTTTAAAAAPTSETPAAPVAMTGPVALAGCTPLTAAATDHLVNGVPYKASGTWYAVTGVNGVGYVVAGVVTPSTSGKIEMVGYTVPSLDAAGFAAVKTLSDSGDTAIGTTGHPATSDPIRSKTQAEMNTLLSTPFAQLQRCQSGQTATPPPYPCSAFEKDRWGDVTDATKPDTWQTALTLSPVGYDNADTVAAWQQTVRTSCPQYTAHIDAAAANYAARRQSMAEGNARTAERKAKIDAGTLINGGGNNVIGSPMQPGTWQTTKDGAKDCYWSLTTSGGDIISNDFIDFAPGRVTVDVPSDAAGFTSNGCGDFELVS